MDDDFSDMSGPAESPRKSGETAGVMVVSAPALNSVEIAIVEQRMLDPFLQIEVDFVELEDDAAPVAITSDPERHGAREDIGRFYSVHIALARSLGRDGTYPQYVEACEREGMVALKLRDFTKV